MSETFRLAEGSKEMQALEEANDEMEFLRKT